MRAGAVSVPLVAACVAAAAIACRDVPAPASGVQAISPLMLPSPAIVVGDSMRDSTGAAAAMRVVAYGVNGEPVDPQPAPSFVLLDTGVAHLEGVYLVGDKAASTVRVVATVAGLQTQPATVLVTLEPDTIVAADSTHQVRSFKVVDTAATADLNVLVQHLGTTPGVVPGVVVHYAITRAPPVVGTGASVLLLAGNVESRRDTTDNSGRASRTLRFRLLAAAPETDSATVTATAAYRGAPLGTVQFTIVFQKQ